MSNKIRWLSALLVLLALGAVLAHGVVVPQFVWRPWVENLQSQYPDQRLDLKRVVAGLSHRPHLMVSGLSIQNEKRAESLDVGLIKLEIDGWDSLKSGQVVIDTLEIKGLDAKRVSSKDCNQQGFKCLPLTPFGLAIAFQNKLSQVPGNPTLALSDIELTQWQLKTRTLRGDSSMSLYVDLLSFLTTDQGENSAKLGLRMAQPTRPEEPKAPVNGFSIAASATPQWTVSGLNLIGVQADATGDWQDLPWSGSVAADAIKFANASGTGNESMVSNRWAFEGTGFRSYVRRDDKPEIHQAAFSSLEFEGGLPMDPMIFKQSEWTFTNEHAKAWTFDLSIIPSLGLVEIQPAVIEGSEGEPAQAQSRILNCKTDTLPMLGLFGQSIELEQEDIRDEKPYWTWHNGWFHSVYEYPDEKVDLVLCPIDQEAKREGLIQLKEDSSLSPHFVK